MKNKILICVLIFTVVSTAGFWFKKQVQTPIAEAAPQTETTILGGNYFNNSVSEVVVDADGIAYVGGSFTSVGKESALAASISTTTGELVTGELGIDTGEGEEVTAVASDGSGGWYIGGYFSLVDGVAINNLVHIESDGSVDEAWDADMDPSSQIYTIVVSGSDIYIAGNFTTIGGQSRSGLAKLSSTDGSLDDTWNPSPDAEVNDIAVSGSDIFVVGDFENIGEEALYAVAKLNNTNGNADADWDPNPDYTVYGVEISGADVYVAGGFNSIGGQSIDYLARISLTANPTGLADATWDPSPDGEVNDIAVSGSDIYVAGGFANIGGLARNKIAKLNDSDGDANVTWNPVASGFDDGMYDIEVSGSNIYVAGDFTSIGGQSRAYLAKLNNTNGNADSSWNASPSAFVTDISVYSSTIFVGGGFSTIGGQAREHLAAIDLSTNELTSWNPAPDGNVSDIAVSGTDIYVSGSFETIGGQTRAGLAKLNNTNGNADATWDPSPSSSPTDITVSGSDIYVVGGFSSIGGQFRNGIAKLNNTDGDADVTWDPGLGEDESANVITISGSYIYVGGDFTAIGGDSRNGLARLLLDGTLDSDWEAATMTGLDSYGNPIAGVEIRDIKISGDDVYIAGTFATIGGVSFNRLARLSTDDAVLDSSWNPNPNSHVYTIAFSGDSIIIGGNFTTIGGQSRNRLAKINKTDGTADTAWNPNLSSYVNTVAIYESSILAGGQFTNRFKRYDFSTVAFSQSTSTFSESAGSGAFGITLSSSSDINSTVAYAVTSGTATGAGVDYTLTSGTATITAGNTTATIPISLINDTIPEVNETLIVTLSNPVGALLGETTTHTVTITDDDSVGGGSWPGGGGASSSGSGGGGPSPIIPDSPALTINNGSLETFNPEVSLQLTAEDIKTKVALSTNPEFTGKPEISLGLNVPWNLCGGSFPVTLCPEGTYKVYAKFSPSDNAKPVVFIVSQIDLKAKLPETTAPPQAPPIKDIFPRNLSRNDRGADVFLLQRLLNNFGFTLSSSGFGSPGNETQFFGPRTQRALMSFQRFFLSSISGRFDDSTRILVNSWMR